MTTVDWRHVASAMLHPTQVAIVELLDGHARSPKELAQRLRQPLATVSHHTRRLRDHGVITLVRTRTVRGGTEHFYELAAGHDDDMRAR